MAIEIQSKNYHFKPSDASANSNANLRASLGKPLVAQELREGVAHNYLHDLESLWWMANYGVFSTAPALCLDDSDAIRMQWDALNEIFPHVDGLRDSRRGHFATKKRFFANLRTTLLLLSQPTAAPFLDIRDNLCASYTAFYEDEEDYRTRRCFLPLYDSYADFYMESSGVASDSVKHLEDLPMILWPQRPLLSIESRRSKRSIESVDGRNKEKPTKHRSPL
jgi:hypothetical protein